MRKLEMIEYESQVPGLFDGWNSLRTVQKKQGEEIVEYSGPIAEIHATIECRPSGYVLLTANPKELDSVYEKIQQRLTEE